VDKLRGLGTIRAFIDVIFGLDIHAKRVDAL
jgi:hypothetical protein